LFLKPIRGISRLLPQFCGATSLVTGRVLRFCSVVFLASLRQVQLPSVRGSLVGGTYAKVQQVTALFVNPYYYFLASSGLGSNIRRLSWSFYWLLVGSFVALIQFSNIFYTTYVDMSWVADSFYFLNF